MNQRILGQVKRVNGPVIEAKGITDARMLELVSVGESGLTGEVINNREAEAHHLRIQRKPEWLRARVPGGEGYVITDWSYRSKINFFLYESVEFTGQALTEGGLRAGYVFGGGKYEAVAFVRNITDQVRVVGGIDFNNLTGFINEPRTIGASFKASF